MYHLDATPEKLHIDWSYYWKRKPLPDYLFEKQIVEQAISKGKKRGKRKIYRPVTGFKS